MTDPDERAPEAPADGAPTPASVDRTVEARADSAAEGTEGTGAEASGAVITAVDGDADAVDTDRSDTGDLDAGDAADPRAVLSRRLAAIAFGIYLVVAFGLLLFHYGDGMWFGGDDWGLLEGRNLWSLGDVLRAQNGHWVTVPVIVYQVLFRLFGLHSYVPYQVLTILLHLTLCVLLRWVMRRAGVGPWVATITAGTFVLFGAGWENLLLALQITLVGSLVFGILQLILADHDGSAGWRDAAGIVCGLLALMCSSTGVAMVAVVGLSTLLRRGWRMALLQVAPLAVLFAAWFAWQRSAGNVDGAGGVVGLETASESTLSPLDLGPWLASAFGATFESLGGFPIVALALGVMLLVGVGLAIHHRGWLAARRTLAPPISLALGAVFLMAFIGTQRAPLQSLYAEIAASSRYQAMVAALVLPALGVAAAELIRRRRILAPVAIVLLLIGVPSSIATLGSDNVLFYGQWTTSSRAFILRVPESPIAADVDQAAHPNPHELLTANLTVGWLRFLRKTGKLPDPPPPDLYLEAIINTRLRVTQSLLEDPVPDHTCREESGPFEVEAKAGDQFVIENPVQIAAETPTGKIGVPIQYDLGWSGSVLTSQFDQTFVVSPAAGQSVVVWCPAD